MDDADVLAAAVRAKRVGRQYACRCPAHDDHDPSLTFWQGERAIRVKCWSGCSPIEVIRAFVANGVWPGGARPRRRSTPPARPNLEEARRKAFMREAALRLWAQAEPALDTLVERYLDGRRSIRMGSLAPDERVRILSDVIRFHPACPCGPDRAPAMVSLMRSVQHDRPEGIHRVFLDRASGAKMGRGMMLGPVGRAAVKLAPKASGLVVCEGVETGLALVLRGDRPVWALGSAGAIERLEPVSGVLRLLVRADADASGTGQRAAAAAVTRWVAHGLEAQATCPRTKAGSPSRDYADVG